MNVFIDIDIFKSDLIDIDIDIDIFKTCRYIDNRYGLSIYRTPLVVMDQWTNEPMDRWTNGLMDQWTNGHSTSRDSMVLGDLGTIKETKRQKEEKKKTSCYWIYGGAL